MPKEFVLDEALPVVDSSLAMFGKVPSSAGVVSLQRDAVIETLRRTVQEVAGVRTELLGGANAAFEAQASEVRGRLEVSRALQQEKTERTRGALQAKANQEINLRSLLRAKATPSGSDDDDAGLATLSLRQKARNAESRRAYAAHIVRSKREHEQALQALEDRRSGEGGGETFSDQFTPLRRDIRQVDEDIVKLTAKLANLREGWELEQHEKAAALRASLVELDRRCKVKHLMPDADADMKSSMKKLGKEQQQLQRLIQREKRRRVYLSATKRRVSEDG